MRMKRIYIAGPFRGPTAWAVEQNIRRAEETSIALYSLGYTCYCPHTNTRFFDGTLTDQFWLDATVAWLPVCDAMILVEGWARSEGTIAEIGEAGKLGVPVFVSIEDLDAYLKRLDNA